MNIYDVFLLAGILLALALAFLSIRKRKKRGGCCGDCAACSRTCKEKEK